MPKTLSRMLQSQWTTTSVWLRTTFQVLLDKLTKLDNFRVSEESAMISYTRDSSKIIFITDGEDTLITKECTGDSLKMVSDMAEENGRPTMERAKMETGSWEYSSENEIDWTFNVSYV